MRASTRSTIEAMLVGDRVSLDDRIDALVDLGATVAADKVAAEDWPVHQPGPAYEAPIAGLHWYGGCEPDFPRVNPATGCCEGCGEQACVVCGKSINEAHEGCDR